MSNIKGLPKSRNPYTSTRDHSGGGGGIGTGSKPVSQPPAPDLGLDSLDLGTPGDEFGNLQEDTVKWEPFSLPNKKDLGFRRTDGFFLRARPLKSVPGKWLAQLYRDDKIIDNGQILIPSMYEPGGFIQRIADYMLDGKSNRYQQDPNLKQPDGDSGTPPGAPGAATSAGDVPDAGVGAPDAGTEDAGMPPDVGTPDVGIPDAQIAPEPEVNTEPNEDDYPDVADIEDIEIDEKTN